MVSETVISALFGVSITGMGLVLAVYALLTPISKEMFEQRADVLKNLINKFNESHSKLTVDSSDEDWKKDTQKRKEIKKIKVIPLSFSVGIIVAFLFFSVSFFFSMLWLIGEVYRNPLLEYSIFVSCFIGWLSFSLVGTSIITEIVDSLTRKFEDIKKKQKEVKETTNADLEKIKKDVEDLKQKEERRVSG